MGLEGCRLRSFESILAFGQHLLEDGVSDICTICRSYDISSTTESPCHTFSCIGGRLHKLAEPEAAKDWTSREGELQAPMRLRALRRVKPQCIALRKRDMQPCMNITVCTESAPSKMSCLGWTVTYMLQCRSRAGVRTLSGHFQGPVDLCGHWARLGHRLRGILDKRSQSHHADLRPLENRGGCG